jgi:uncharacterized membrane protein YdjX (TVP38/TMEM64 family)
MVLDEPQSAQAENTPSAPIGGHIHALPAPTPRRRATGNARWLLLLIVVVGIAAFFLLDLQRFLSVDYLISVRASANAVIAAHPLATAGAFFLVYVLVAALSLPGAAVMTLAAGALFGFGWGLLIVSFASSIGATLAMLIARGLLRDWVQGRFGSQLEAVNAGFRRDGGFYLFGLRMVPLFPFFIVNLVMGLTPIDTRRFYWVSQLGMLPGTAVYVFAGTELGQVATLPDVLSPGLIAALTLLGLFPIVARRALALIASRRPTATGPH